MLYKVKEVSLYSYFLRIYYKCMLSIVKLFVSTLVGIIMSFFFIIMLHWLIYFYIEPVLQPLNTLHLVMVYNSFHIYANILYRICVLYP